MIYNRWGDLLYQGSSLDEGWNGKNFMGEDAAYAARRVCSNHTIPTYRTPEGAVGAFMHLVSYRRNQKHLTQTPESNTDDAKINKSAATTLINEFLEEDYNAINNDTEEG